MLQELSSGHVSPAAHYRVGWRSVWRSLRTLTLLWGACSAIGCDNGASDERATSVDAAVATDSSEHDAAANKPSEGEFVALTYNVHGLPAAITGDDTPARITAIAPLLNAFELVGLQEDFDEMNHATLASASDHSDQLRFGDALDDRFYGSGLSIFSRFEIIEHQHHHYTGCNGRFDSASDCLASKGFQVARVRLSEGIEVDVYNTHLEAGNSAEDNEVRSAHVDELLAVMSTYSADRALLFLADTNLHEDDPTDAIHLTRLVQTAELLDACEAVMCPEPGRIDRVMYRSSESVELNATTWQVEPAFFDPDGTPLSDHDAISATIEWVRTAN